MASETTHVSSIPVEGMSVKSAMRSLLRGLPVVSRYYGATLGLQTTAEQFTLASTRLCGVQREVIVCARFQLGDMWLQWQEDAFKIQRAVWHAQLRERIPDQEKREKYLRMFHECGGVAMRWPEKHRTDKYGWTYLLNHEVTVSGEIVKRGGSEGKVRVPMRSVVRYLRDTGEYIECLDARDRSELVFVDPSMPTIDQRTVKP